MKGIKTNFTKYLSLSLVAGVFVVASAYGQLQIQTNLINRVQTIMSAVFTTDGLPANGTNEVVSVNVNNSNTITLHDAPVYDRSSLQQVLGLNATGDFGSISGSELAQWMSGDILNLLSGLELNAMTDFDGDRPITRNTPGMLGLHCGSAAQSGTVTDFLECVFFPALAPGASIDGGITLPKNNQTTISRTFNWSADEKTNALQSITLTQSANITATTPPAITVNGGDQNGSYTATLPASPTFPNSSVTVTVRDVTGKAASATATVSWTEVLYYGKLPNYVYADDTALQTALKTMTAYNQNNASLSRSFGSGPMGWVYVAIPSSLADGLNFTSGGQPMTNMTKLKDNMSMDNGHGFVTDYDVWRFDSGTVDPLQLSFSPCNSGDTCIQ